MAFSDEDIAEVYEDSQRPRGVNVDSRLLAGLSYTERRGGLDGAENERSRKVGGITVKRPWRKTRSDLKLAFTLGLSTREAARFTGCTPRTAKRWFGRWNKAQARICACGAPMAHRGWCSVRFAAHPIRQATMKALHDRQRRERRLDAARMPQE